MRGFGKSLRAWKHAAALAVLLWGGSARAVPTLQEGIRPDSGAEVSAAASREAKTWPVVKSAATPDKAPFKEWKSTPPALESPAPMTMLQGLALCFGVFLILVYVLKRVKGVPSGGNGRKLRVLERISISPRSSAVLLAVGGREVLVSVGPERVTLLSDNADAQDSLRALEVLAHEESSATPAQVKTPEGFA